MYCSLFIRYALCLSFYITLTLQKQYDSLSYSDLTQLLTSLSSATNVSETQILHLISPNGQHHINPNVLHNPIAQDKLFILLNIISKVVGQPLKETTLDGLLITSKGQNELKTLMEAIKSGKKRNDVKDGDSSLELDVSDTKSSSTDRRQKRNQGVLVPISSNSGFKPLSRGVMQPVGSSLYQPQPEVYQPQPADNSRNAPFVLVSSGSGTKLPLEPIPSSIFDRLDSNHRQPVYIFTRIDPITGAILSPNMIFRVNYTAGKPVQPFLLTYLSTGIAQPILKSLLNILNENSNGPEEPTYLLSRVNETNGIPTPPFLIFNTNRATKQPKAPYVLSRLDLPSGRPTQPEILQYLDRETGQLIVQEMLPLLNGYIEEDVKKKR